MVLDSLSIICELMNRHLLSVFLSVSLLSLLAVGSLSAGERPNIILILADDMGVGEMSHTGGLVPTPALDRMAEEGMSFTLTQFVGLHADAIRNPDRALQLAQPSQARGPQQR